MGGRSRGGSEQRSPYSPQFITALHEFGDRARASLGVEAASDMGDCGSGGGGNLEGGGRKGEKTAGSAAAEAGGWLLNRSAYFVFALVFFFACTISLSDFRNFLAFARTNTHVNLFFFTPTFLGTCLEFGWDDFCRSKRVNIHSFCVGQFMLCMCRPHRASPLFTTLMPPPPSSALPFAG